MAGSLLRSWVLELHTPSVEAKPCSCYVYEVLDICSGFWTFACPNWRPLDSGAVVRRRRTGRGGSPAGEPGAGGQGPRRGAAVRLARPQEGVYCVCCAVGGGGVGLGLSSPLFFQQEAAALAAKHACSQGPSYAERDTEIVSSAGYIRSKLCLLKRRYVFGWEIHRRRDSFAFQVECRHSFRCWVVVASGDSCVAQVKGGPNCSPVFVVVRSATRSIARRAPGGVTRGNRRPRARARVGGQRTTYVHGSFSLSSEGPTTL